MRESQNDADGAASPLKNTGENELVSAPESEYNHLRTLGLGKPNVRPKRRRKADGPRKYLKTHEKDAFFCKITSVRDRALFRLMYHYGLRASEPGLLQLSDFSDVRADVPAIFIRRKKGSKSREFPLVRVCVESLRAWVRVRGKEPGPLFVSRNHGPICSRQVFRLYRKYCQLAGCIPSHLQHPHALKHTCGTHMMERTKNVAKVQAQLGHRNIANTMIYADWTEAASAETARELRDWR
jgi:site-specific recombinase XerC